MSKEEKGEEAEYCRQEISRGTCRRTIELPAQGGGG
jgi:HSP20 family molecular chaperone IbpA